MLHAKLLAYCVTLTRIVKSMTVSFVPEPEQFPFPLERMTRIEATLYIRSKGHNISDTTLTNLFALRRGPAFEYLSGAAFYSSTDIDLWLKTSDFLNLNPRPKGRFKPSKVPPSITSIAKAALSS